MTRKTHSDRAWHEQACDVCRALGPGSSAIWAVLVMGMGQGAQGLGSHCLQMALEFLTAMGLP